MDMHRVSAYIRLTFAPLIGLSHNLFPMEWLRLCMIITGLDYK